MYNDCTKKKRNIFAMRYKNAPLETKVKINFLETTNHLNDNASP